MQVFLFLPFLLFSFLPSCISFFFLLRVTSLHSSSLNLLFLSQFTSSVSCLISSLSLCYSGYLYLFQIPVLGSSKTSSQALLSLNFQSIINITPQHLPCVLYFNNWSYQRRANLTFLGDFVVHILCPILFLVSSL